MATMKTILTYSWITVVLISANFGKTEGNTVLHKNGYEGIVVAIGNHVEEHPDIIDNIKRMFEEGSEILYEATRQRAYFGEVTIVVPASWEHKDEYEVTQGSGWLSDAEIRIDLPHPAYGVTPYTLQPGGCGEPASYIHLSHLYAAEMYGRLHDVFGRPGKVLVHEWSHLRWGVFDEYGEPETPFPPFYIGEDLEVHSTSCTDSLKGWLMTEEGEQCQADTRGLPDGDCHFYPSSHENVNGSLMSLYFLDSVTQFCDNEDIPHNSWAPNAQNLRCDGKSTWEVISNHEDFKNNNNPPRSKRSIPDFRPKFAVIQESPKQKPRFVLLLDLSESMDIYMTLFYQEVVRFVRDLIPTGSLISVVSFANVSHVDVNFTQVTNSNREDIVNRLPKNYTIGGYTAIGSAMQSVLELIKENDIKSEGLMVVLITDGHETMYPLVSSVLPEIKSQGIIINTVSLGPNATDSLEEWAFKTGGRSYYHRTDSPDSATSLDALLFDSITKGDSELNQELLQVHREIVKVKPGLNNSITGEIVLDSSVGHLTKFTFTEQFKNYNSFSITVNLTSPDGDNYGATSDHSIYKVDSTTRTITFTVPHAKPGQWTYNISNLPLQREPPIPDDVLVAVTSYPSHETPEEPIRVKAWMPANNINYPAPAPVYAHVSQGYSIVVNANVTALIEPPTQGSVIRIPLVDDGVGADLQAGDGIYSAYFTQFSGNGRYSLSAVVSTTNLTKILRGYKASDLAPINAESPSTNAIRVRALPVPENSLSEPESKFPVKNLALPDAPDGSEKRNLDPLEKVPVEPFTRFTSGGIFKVTNYQPGDQQPPGRVTDLKVSSLSLYEATVTLEWTSPGDDLYHGTASSLELRYHKSRKISQDFHIGHQINDSHLIKGDLIPLMSGHPHKVTIKMLERKLEDLESRAWFFCLRARDEVGNSGDVSNIATAYFPLREYARNIKEEQRMNAITGLVVLGVIGFMVICIVLFIATVKLLHIRNKKKKRSQELIEGGYRYYS